MLNSFCIFNSIRSRVVFIGDRKCTPHPLSTPTPPPTHPLPHPPPHPASTPAPAPTSPAASPAVPGEGSTTASAAGSVNGAKGKDPVAAPAVSGEGGSAAGDNKPQAAGGGGGGGAAASPVEDKGAGAAVKVDEPWIVGRVLDDADMWLGTKQEKLRKLFVGGVGGGGVTEKGGGARLVLALVI